MYQLISAIAKPISGGGRWAAVAIGDMSLNSLFTKYDKVLVTLTNPFLPTEVCLDIATIRAQYGGRTITFNQFLAGLDNESLETTDKLPVINTRYVRYNDLRAAGYDVEPIHPSAAPDSNYPEADKTWLYITRKNTDYALFYKSVLVSVNGYYHMTSFNSQGVYVVNGAKTGYVSNENHIGGLSFRTVGNLQFIPITQEMVSRLDPNEPMKNGMIVDLGIDIGMKTVMVVIGGYLHVQDERSVFTQGDQSLSVQFNNFPLLDRYYESIGRIDLSSLGMETTNFNPMQINVEELYGDRALKAYMTLPQSFVVLIDNSDIFLERVAVHAELSPDEYVSDVLPTHCLINKTGRAVNYWPEYDEGKWILSCTDAEFKPHMFNTTDGRNVPSVDPALMSHQYGRNSAAHLLVIGTDI